MDEEKSRPSHCNMKNDFRLQKKYEDSAREAYRDLSEDSDSKEE